MEKIYKDNEFMKYPKEKKVYNLSTEAIPIEWLKNELIPKAKKLGATDYVDNIMFVLEDWEAWKKYRG